MTFGFLEFVKCPEAQARLRDEVRAMRAIIRVRDPWCELTCGSREQGALWINVYKKTITDDVLPLCNPVSGKVITEVPVLGGLNAVGSIAVSTR